MDAKAVKLGVTPTGVASRWSEIPAKQRWAPNTRVTLNNGVQMPVYGLGMSHNGGGDYANGIRSSLAAGVRHFDTAARYGTEKVLGDTLRQWFDDSKASPALKRSDVFVTSKLWPSDADNVKGAFKRSLDKLGMEYVDLYLVHWPGLGGSGQRAKKRRQEVWRELELLADSGSAKAIGVSNFLERHLEDVLETASIAPAVNQIEFNPFQNPKNLVALCEKLGVQVEGYCPLAKGYALRDAKLSAIAKSQSCSIAQLLLRWSLQKHVVTIPKSCTTAHIKSNADGVGMGPLPGNVEALLDSMHKNLRCTWDPTNVD